MDLKKASYDLLLKNRRVTDGHQYTVPSPDTYPYQWLWDSCFHAIILARLEPEAAKEELRSLMVKQLPNGMVPHMIYWEPGPLHNFEWGIPGVSAITQPPMIAYALWEIHKQSEDLTFIKELYPKVLSFYRYLINDRDPRDHHLAGIINPDESGEDNSPRFDEPLKVPIDISVDDHFKRRLELVDATRACNFVADICMNRHFWVKDVPFNAILLENLRCLGHLASLVGDADGEHFCTEHAALVAEAMRYYMLDDGICYSVYGPDEYKMIKMDTWAHFAPLFADVYTKEEAASLMDRFFSDEETLKAPYGIRTVSKREPSYRPDGFWRGPVWMATNWFAFRGFMRYGYAEEARWIRERSIALLELSGFREQFNPETGEGYGAHDFTWSTLVLDMFDGDPV